MPTERPGLSVIMCAHNPQPLVIGRTIAALERQTTLKKSWELLVIDNASSSQLALSIDLSWHPRARHVREERVGLTHARLRGIAESKSDLLIFVDDDNLLDPDYLAKALEIAQNFPKLGAWGGSIVPEFASPPPAWAENHLWLVSVRKIHERHIGSSREPGLLPWGAGLCVRRVVATEYARLLSTQENRAALDRSGGSLSSAGDTDLVLTALDLGLATGLFPELVVTHLIPATRVEPDYLQRMAREMAQSLVLLDFHRGGHPRGPSLAGRAWAYARHFAKGWRAFQLYREAQRGRDAALEQIKLLRMNKNESNTPNPTA